MAKDSFFHDEAYRKIQDTQHFKIKLVKIISNSDYHTYLPVRGSFHSKTTAVVRFFYLSHGLVWVCEIEV